MLTKWAMQPFAESIREQAVRVISNETYWLRSILDKACCKRRKSLGQSDGVEFDSPYFRLALPMLFSHPYTFNCNNKD